MRRYAAGLFMIFLLVISVAGPRTAAAQEGGEFCGEVNPNEQWVDVVDGNAPQVCIDPTGLENGVEYPDPVLCDGGYYRAVIGWTNYLECLYRENPDPAPWNGCTVAGQIVVDGVCVYDPELDNDPGPDDTIVIGGQARVVGTDGDGVYCRTAPNEGAGLVVIPEGAIVSFSNEEFWGAMRVISEYWPTSCFVNSAYLEVLGNEENSDGAEDSSQIEPTDDTIVSDDGTDDSGSEGNGSTTIEDGDGPHSTDTLSADIEADPQAVASIIALPDTGSGPLTAQVAAEDWRSTKLDDFVIRCAIVLVLAIAAGLLLRTAFGQWLVEQSAEGRTSATEEGQTAK